MATYTGFSTIAVEALKDSDFVDEIISAGLSYHEYVIAASYTTPVVGQLIELSSGEAIRVATADNAIGILVRKSEGAENKWLVCDFGAVIKNADYNSLVVATVNTALRARGITVITAPTFEQV